MLLKKAALVIAVAGILSSTSALAGNVTWEEILNDADSTSDVLMYGFGPTAQRYSPLKTINADNVKNL